MCIWLPKQQRQQSIACQIKSISNIHIYHWIYECKYTHTYIHVYYTKWNSMQFVYKWKCTFAIKWWKNGGIKQEEQKNYKSKIKQLHHHHSGTTENAQISK